MGRKVVVELKCDRCGRTEHNAPDTRGAGEPIFKCEFQKKVVEFGDLCSGCTEVVATHVADIMREMKKVSPIRKNETRTKALAKMSTQPAQQVTPAPVVPPKPAPQPPKTPVPGENKAAPHGASQRP
jgi:hypothetical protein